MSDRELQVAMQPGSKSPLEQRPQNDLGRFGLGLKTASFSQARQLTVLSCRGGDVSGYEWDLDHVQKVNKWQIKKIQNVSEVPFSELLPNDHGTIVVWQKVDRMGHGPGEPITQDTFDRAIKSIHDHLGLVFHRFLDGTSFVRSKISITLNNLNIASRNPFNLANLRTTADAPDQITYGRERQTITVQAFTLPHPRTVSEKEWKEFEGEKGYDGSQGFYLYRADRLIVAGDWFRIIPKSPSTKLLRIALDVSNQSDSDWQINVLKAHAQPPIVVRRELANRLLIWTAAARRPYVARGKVLPSVERFSFWTRQVEDREIRYSVDQSNPAVTSFMSKLDPKLQTEFENLLEYIVSSIPYDSMFVDLSDNHGHVSYSNASAEQLRNLAQIIAQSIRADSPGTTIDQVRDVLKMIPMFTNHPELIDSFEWS
jgi:hypothetical protein